jgi:hypothetical protein
MVSDEELLRRGDLRRRTCPAVELLSDEMVGSIASGCSNAEPQLSQKREPEGSSSPQRGQIRIGNSVSLGVGADSPYQNQKMIRPPR